MPTLSSPPSPQAAGTAVAARPTLSALWELGGLWLLIVLAGIALIASLLLDVRAQEEAQIQRSRLSLTLVELQDAIEGDLALGFDLPDHRGIQPRLERALASDTQLYAIDVVDRAGIALFSTDRGAIGEALQPRAARAAETGARQDRIWSAALTGEAIMGLPLHNAFGEVVGHISATYATQPVRFRLAVWQADGQTLTLGAMAVLVLAIAGLLGWLATLWALQPQSARLRAECQRTQTRALARSAQVRQRMDECLVRLDESERTE